VGGASGQDAAVVGARALILCDGSAGGNVAAANDNDRSAADNVMTPMASDSQLTGNNDVAVSVDDSAATDNTWTPMLCAHDMTSSSGVATNGDRVDYGNHAVRNEPAMPLAPNAVPQYGNDEVSSDAADSAIAHAIEQASLWEMYDEDDGKDDTGSIGPDPTYMAALNEALMSALEVVHFYGGPKPSDAINAPKRVREAARCSKSSSIKRLLCFEG
jgi:hypothetical protein